MDDPKLEIEGYQVTVMQGPYTVDGHPTAAATEYVLQLIGLLDQMRDFAAIEYLPLYNDSWREEDAPTLTREEFMSRLTNPLIVLYDELGAAAIYFDDSDMFAGHAIEVSVESGQIVDASLVG